MNTIIDAGSLFESSRCLLQRMGFELRTSTISEMIIATRKDEEYVAKTYVAILGLIKLVEMAGWKPWLVSFLPKCLENETNNHPDINDDAARQNVINNLQEK